MAQLTRTHLEATMKKLMEALDHPEKAEKVGQKGRELVDTTFDPRYQAEKMLSFFRQINEQV